LRKIASKTVIGSFVVSALALVVAGVLIFGSGDFFRERYNFVLFFKDSVKGLNPGAPVVFLGVQIGEVKEITLIENPSTSSFLIQVIIELTSGKIRKFKSRDIGGAKEIYEYCNQLIKQGLRARLGLQSVVTGQLQIELNFNPEEEAVFVETNSKHQQIPTIPSTFERFTRTLEKLPIEVIVDKLSSSLNRIESLLKSTEFQGVLQSMNLAMQDLRKISHKLNKEITPMANTFRQTIQTYDRLAQNLNQQVDPLTSSVNELVKTVAEASKQADNTLKKLDGFFDEDSVTTVEMKTTLKEFSSAARSIRNLADYLNRHPEALFRGKTAETR